MYSKTKQHLNIKRIRVTWGGQNYVHPTGIQPLHRTFSDIPGIGPLVFIAHLTSHGSQPLTFLLGRGGGGVGLPISLSPNPLVQYDFLSQVFDPVPLPISCF